jgi:hypothetical protein
MPADESSLRRGRAAAGVTAAMRLAGTMAFVSISRNCVDGWNIAPVAAGNLVTRLCIGSTRDAWSFCCGGARRAICASGFGAATNATNCGLRASSTDPTTRAQPTTPTSARAARDEASSCAAECYERDEPARAGAPTLPAKAPARGAATPPLQSALGQKQARQAA